MMSSRRTAHLPVPAFLIMAVLLVTSCASSPVDTLETFGKIMDSPAGDAVFASIESINEAREEITPENEYYIGRSVGAAITRQYPVYKDAPDTTAYLNAICGAITMNSDVPYLYKGYCVAILDTDEINAMATPGGHIFVSRGLINAVNCEDALAAVLAHEIAHIQLKHSLKAIKTSRITGAVAQSVKATAMVGVIMANEKENGGGLSDKDMQQLLEATASFSDITDEIAEKLINSGFSKSQEYDADAMALELMAGAGYDPNAMLDMLSKIPSDGKHGWGATHPKPAKRIDEAEDALEDVEVPYISSAARDARQARFEANRLH